jgi:hypothetical protein
MMALTLRRTWPDSPHPKEDWLVLDDGVVVGRIFTPRNVLSLSSWSARRIASATAHKAHGSTARTECHLRSQRQLGSISSM